MNIGERIKKIRLKKNLTQDELALKINTTKQTIYKYENGIITNIPSSKIEAIANALNTTPEYLMGWENNSKSSATSKLIDDESLKFALFDGDEEITDEQLEEVKKFAKFIKERDKNE